MDSCTAEAGMDFDSKCFFVLMACALLAAVCGCDRTGAAFAAERGDGDPIDAKTIARLRSLGAVVEPFNSSAEFLTVEVHLRNSPACDPPSTPWNGTESDLAEIAKLRNVACVYMDFPVKNQDSLQFLPRLPQLKVLNDPAACISDDGLRYVAACPSLEEFSSISAMTDVGLKRLATAPSLRRLKIVSLWRVTDEGLVGIEKLTHLAYLAIVRSRITHRGVARLKNLVSLTELNLSESLIADDAVEEFGQFKNLERLTLHGTKLSAPACAKLRRALPQCHVETEPEGKKCPGPATLDNPSGGGAKK
jgi:hypothetical protein